ncbi:MAG: TadE/TadG family type IV pilus assembly protein [Acidimicrobiia bacterium]|nr:TadE/TadG family type IV pilus assembly protein [Acidimicrobiia bacterium]
MNAQESPRREHGAAVVEMALILPLVVLLAFALIDIGRLIYTKIDLHEAVQEGSIWGAYNPDDYLAVQTRVAESLNGDVYPGDVVVECPSSTDTVRVTLSHGVPLITPLFNDRTITLTVSAEGDLLSDDPCQASP